MVHTAIDSTAWPLEEKHFVDADIFGPEMKSNPIPRLVEWAQRAPFYVRVAGVPQVVVTRYADVKRAYEDYEHFTSVKQKLAGTEQLDYFSGLPVLSDFDPPAHTRLRRLMQPAFTPRKLASVEAGIQAYTDSLLDTVAQRGHFEAMEDIGHPLAAHSLLGLLLNIEPEDFGIFLRLSRALGTLAEVPPGSPPPQEYREAWAAGRAYCEAAIERRRSKPEDDLIGNIVAAQGGEDPLTTEELFATLMVLFVAGIGTIADLIGLSMIRLCRHPDQLALLREEPALILSAMEEILRIDAPGNFNHRFAAKDFEFEGLPIYRGMPVHLSMSAANFDPQLFPDPTRFDVRRNPRNSMTFGHGAHKCIGLPLVRLSGRIAIGGIVQRFPKLRLRDPDFVPEWMGVPTERAPKAVPLLVD